MAVTACQNPATEPLIGARSAHVTHPTTLKLRRRALLGADGSNESFNRLLAQIYRLVPAGFGRHLVEETDDRSLVAGGVAVP